MNKDDRKNIQEAVVQIIFGLSDEQGIQELKEFCTQSIKDILEETKQKALIDINRAKKDCQMCVNEVDNAIQKYYDMNRTVYNAEHVCEEMKKMLSKYEATKRAANEVVNNAVIDGFECSVCGCIVKNINVGGRWTKCVRFCPNCGGENIAQMECGQNEFWYNRSI